METIKEDLLELFNKFETYKICIEGKSNSTTTLYIRNIKEFCNDMQIYSKDDLINTTASTIKEWLIKLAENNNNESTRNNKLTSIKQIFAFLEDELDIMVDRKISKIKFAKTSEKEYKYVSESLLEELLDAAGTQELRAIMSVLYYTGVRISELLQITCSGIMQNYMVVTTKGNKKRTIKFNYKTLVECKAYMFGERQEVINRTGVDTDLLFITYNGRPKDKPVILRSLKECGKKANIPWYNELSPHKFRHGRATELLNKGIPIQLVRDLLGHSSISTTNTYAHSNQQLLDKIMTGEIDYNDLQDEEFSE